MRVLTENGSIGKLDGPGWSPQTALKAKRLLMEFHHVFSLEPNEMGCTDTAEHTIKLLTGEDEPFKERFRRITPHEVEEVRQHIQEMLGWRSHLSVPIALVQCSRISTGERQSLEVLYLFQAPER